MKKYLLPLLALLAMASCSRRVDYIAKFQAEADKMSQESLKYINNHGMSREQKEVGLDSVWTVFKPKLYAIATKALSQHNDDSVAVFMVSTLFNWDIVDSEETVANISKLGPNAASNSRIIEISENIKRVEATAEGKQFIDFTITQPDGTVKSLSQYAGNGKYCLVDMWASWCGPCKAQIPFLQQAYDKFASKGLNIVSVAVWDKPEDTIQAAQEHNIRWAQIINAQEVPTDIYGVTGIPQIILIGPDGTILKRNLNGEDIIAEIEKYL